MENQKITKVVTKSVSRFGRNTEEVLEAYRAILSRGASVFFELQDLDSSQPDCEFYLSLYSGIAQEENRQLSENIKWGIRSRAKQGTSALYNRPCYGYWLNDEGQLEIKKGEASIVRRIFSMYVQGLSVVKIKKQLESEGVLSPTGKTTWSKHTIESILINKKYIGTSEIYKTYMSGHPHSKRQVNRDDHDRYEMEDHHIPIITKEIFEAAQRAKKERTNIEVDENGNTRRKAKKYSAAKIEPTDNSPVTE